MTLATLLILRQAFAESCSKGFNILAPDFEDVVTAKRELDAAIDEAAAAAPAKTNGQVRVSK